MAVVPCFRVKVDAVIVAASIGSLKVALTVLVTAMPVAVSVGSVEETDGTPAPGVPALLFPNSTSCCPQPASDARRRAAARFFFKALIRGPLLSR